MTAGLALVAPVTPDALTDQQIVAFRDSLRPSYYSEREACEVALRDADHCKWDEIGWRGTARKWVAYRINRLAGVA